jgi:hypothetical protein
LGGEDEIAEASLRGSREDEEEHDGAVDGDQGEIVFGEDGAVEPERPCGPDEVDAHQEGEESADDDGDEREGKVLEADGAVVGKARGGTRNQGIRTSVPVRFRCQVLWIWSHWADSF